MSQVLTNATTDTPSSAVRCFYDRTGPDGYVNVYVSGLTGGSLELQALLPDGSAWKKVAGADNPITVDGMYTFRAAPCVLRLDPLSLTGTVNAWIEPDDEDTRDNVRTVSLA